MWRKSIVITRKKQRKKKNRTFLTIFFSLILLAVILLFLWNREFFTRVNHINKNIEKILLSKDNFLLFSDGEKQYNLNMETGVYEEILFNFKERRILNIFDEKNILFQEENTLENTLGDSVEIEKLEDIDIRDSYIIVKADGKYGAFDKRLNVVIPLQYGYLAKGESFFLAKNENNKFGYLNLEGKEQIPFQYDIGNLDKDGEMVVYKDGKAGVINNKNEKKIELRYDNLINLSPFSLMKNKDNFYFYSPEVPEKKLDILWAGFYNGKTFFYEKDSKFGLMRKDGKKLTENIYDEMGQSNINAIIVRKDGKYGLIDQKGREVSKNIYDYIIPIGNNFFIAGKDGNESAVVLNSLGIKIFYEDRYSGYHEVNKDFLIVDNKDSSKLLNKFGKSLDDINDILVLNKNWLVYTNKFGINYLKLRGEI